MKKIAIDVTELEKSLTMFVANKLGLTVDVNVFRGGIPDGVDEGLGVLIDTDKSNGATWPSVVYEIHAASRAFDAQVVGKYNTREQAWSMVTALRDLYPVWNEPLHNFTIVSMTGRGDCAVYPVADAGRTKYYTSLNLQLCAVPKTETPST